jgi:hypothetical protein
MENYRKQAKVESVGCQLLGRDCQESENTGKEKNMTHNQGVAGSIPAGPTSALRSFSEGGLFYLYQFP